LGNLMCDCHRQSIDFDSLRDAPRSVSFLRQKQENGTSPSINNRVTKIAAPGTHCHRALPGKLNFYHPNFIHCLSPIFSCYFMFRTI